MPIGQLNRDSAVSVPTDSMSTVALPVALVRQATPERLRSLSSGTHTFLVWGRATFRTPIGSRKVRFAQEGSMRFGARSIGSLP
jgi:hypothetical protein